MNRTPYFHRLRKGASYNNPLLNCQGSHLPVISATGSSVSVRKRVCTQMDAIEQCPLRPVEKPATKKLMLKPLASLLLFGAAIGCGELAKERVDAPTGNDQATMLVH